MSWKEPAPPDPNSDPRNGGGQRCYATSLPVPLPSAPPSYEEAVGYPHLGHLLPPQPPYEPQTGTVNSEHFGSSFDFLVDVFEENTRLLQWLVFFRQFNAIGPLSCSFVQHHQLELRTSKTYSKRQNLVENKNIDVQNLENIGCPFGVFHSDFFGTHFFLDFTKGSPLRLFRYFATQWISKKSLLHFSAL